jgi:outer membrane protein
MTRRTVSVLLTAMLLPATAAAQEAQTYHLTLGDAARLAAQRSTPVLEAQARTAGAEARVRQTLSDLLPSVDANAIQGGRTFNTASFGLDFAIPGQPPLFDPNGEVIGPVKTTDVRAHATVPLLDLAAIGRRRSAEASASAARAGEGAAADAAAGAAARVYVATLRARSEVTARQEDLRLAQELLNVAHGLVDSGVGVAIDVTRAEAQVATIQAQLLAAQHQAQVTELSLRRALRLPDGASLELADDLETLGVDSVPSEQDAIDTALAARSDLRMAQASEDAATKAASATRAGRLPRLSLTGDDGYYGQRWDSHMLNTYTWTLLLSVPVFDGFDRSAQIQEQEAQAREIGYRIEDLREEVAFEVRQGLLDLSAARQQADAAAERQRLAELEVSQEEERVRAGVSGTADVVRAAQGLNEARTARLDALAAVQTSRVSLAAAMGTVDQLP